MRTSELARSVNISTAEADGTLEVKRHRRIRRRMIILSVLAVASIAAFMLVGIEGSWGFAIPFRGRKVAAMVIVALAISFSTVLFQTVTNNRILTPSIMGFDSLYLLVQTGIVFAFGANALVAIDNRLAWLGEVAVMVLFSTLLFRWIFSVATRSIHVLVLVGIVFGVLFGSLSALMQRMLDPTEFAIVQDTFFASFTAVDTQLMGLTATIVVALVIAGIKFLPIFDVVALGESHAIGLGVNHRRTVTLMLVVIAILVSVSTALVGPIIFFGLIVSNLAYTVMGTTRHHISLPASALLGVICLVGGQFILEHILGHATVIGVVIEFVGGLLFIALLMKRGVR